MKYTYGIHLLIMTPTAQSCVCHNKICVYLLTNHCNLTCECYTQTCRQTCGLCNKVIVKCQVSVSTWNIPSVYSGNTQSLLWLGMVCFESLAGILLPSVWYHHCRTRNMSHITCQTHVYGTFNKIL